MNHPTPETTRAPTSGEAGATTKTPRLRMRRHWKAIGAFLGALTLYFLVKNLPESWTKSGQLEHALIAVVVATLVHLLDRLTLHADFAEELRRLQQELSTRVENDIQKIEAAITALSNQSTSMLRKQFALLAAAEDCGLVAILPPRQHGDAITQTHKEIISAISESQTVELIGISLTEFFSWPRGAESGGRYFKHLFDLLELPEDRCPLRSFRVLAINPESEAAKFRASIESCFGLQANIAKNVEDSTSTIVRLNSRPNQRVKIEWRHYDHAPQVYLIRTDTFVFVEHYHSASTVELSKALNLLSAGSNSHGATCVGGKIPVFKYQTGFSTYIAMEKHFDTLWRSAPEAPQSSTLRV